MLPVLNKGQVVFLIDTNLAICKDCNHVSEILIIVSRILSFVSENCKKSQVTSADKVGVYWGIKFFNSSVAILKKSYTPNKFEPFNLSSIKSFEKLLKESFQNFEKTISSSKSLSNQPCQLLSKALTEILHDFDWCENDGLLSPIARKRENVLLEDNGFKKMVFLLSRSPSCQKSLRKFSSKLIMDAEVFLDSFMSPALLNEYQKKHNITFYWIDMKAENCKSSFEIEKDENVKTKFDVTTRAILVETCKMLGGCLFSKDNLLRLMPMNNRGKDVTKGGLQFYPLHNLLSVESCLHQLFSKEPGSVDEMYETYLSSHHLPFGIKQMNDLAVQLVPVRSKQNTRAQAECPDLHQAKLMWLGCVSCKENITHLMSKVSTSYVMDCNKNILLFQIHKLLQLSCQLGVLIVETFIKKQVLVAVMQPFADGQATMSLLNLKESFHGELLYSGILTSKDISVDGRYDLKSLLLQKVLESSKEKKTQVLKEEKFSTESFFSSHTMNSWHIPGCIPGMASLVSSLNQRSANKESYAKTEKSFLKELRQFYIKEKQPPEVITDIQPSTSTPLCAIRKPKADAGDSASRVSVRQLRSSSLTRGKLMVDKARTASFMSVGDADTSLLSALCSTDRNSSSFVDIDISSEEELINYCLKQYDQVLNAGIALESSVRAIVNVATQFMSNSHQTTQKSSSEFVRQLLVKSSKELKEKFSQKSTTMDKNIKITEYKLQILLLLELEFISREEDKIKQDLLKELTLMLRALMFLTGTMYLNDFLTESILVSYSAALPQLLLDVYDELMLPLPPVLSKFASPDSAKAPMSVYNEDSILSAPGSTQTSSHMSSDQQTRRTRFKQHPSISDFRHTKQILIKPKLKAEVKSSGTVKEKVKVKVRTSRRRHTVTADITKAKRNLFSEKCKTPTKQREEESSHRKKSRHLGRSKTLVLGTPTHKQTSQRFIRQQERRRKLENIDPEVKVIAESPLKDDDPTVSSALAKSTRYLLRESFYSSSSQPSRNVSRSLELSQKSGSQMNLSDECQMNSSRMQGTLSGALRGSPNISPKTRFMKSFIFSPSPPKLALRRSPRKSVKKLEFRNVNGRSSTADAHLIFDGENANDSKIDLNMSGSKTPEKRTAVDNSLCWETASCPPLMVTPVKKSSAVNNLTFKNAITPQDEKLYPGPSQGKNSIGTMVLRSTPNRGHRNDLSTPVKGSNYSPQSHSSKRPESINSPVFKSRSDTLNISQHTPKKLLLCEHTPKKLLLCEALYTPEKLSTPSKVKFSEVDVSCQSRERIPPSLGSATPKKSILKNSPSVKEKLERSIRRVELQAVTSPLKLSRFGDKALSGKKSLFPENSLLLAQNGTFTQVRKTLSPSHVDKGGRELPTASVTIHNPSPNVVNPSDTFNKWARKKRSTSPTSSLGFSPSKACSSTITSLPPSHTTQQQPETPKKSACFSEIKPPRKRNLFQLEDVSQSPCKRARKDDENLSTRLRKTNTLSFNPSSSPNLFDDDGDEYVSTKPSSSKAVSPFHLLSNSSQSASISHCVLTPVKSNQHSSSTLGEASQGFVVFPSLAEKNHDERTSPEPAQPSYHQSLGSDKRHFSPVLSANGLLRLIKSPLLSPESSNRLSPLRRSFKSRKHLDLH